MNKHRHHVNAKPNKSKPPILQSMSADPYNQQQKSQPQHNNNVNLLEFPIFENTNGNRQPPLRTIASAPECYNNNNNNNNNENTVIRTLHHHQNNTQQQQYNQYMHHYQNNTQQHQQQQYTSEQLRRMYEEYQDYYNKYKQQQNQQQNQPKQKQQQQYQYNSKSHSEYISYLIKTVREQTEEINQMQQKISELEKKINCKKLLEEDFYSFLSRIEFPEWISSNDKALCLNKLFENEKEKLFVELEEAKVLRRTEAQCNLMLETKIIELNDEISLLRDYLEQEKHQNYLQYVKIQSHPPLPINNKNNKNNNLYPPENIIIQNLIRTQIEFYFSDYNLKRDKRLLDQLCSDRIGFLKIDSVMNLTRVRQLSSHRNQVINSLRNSKFLSLTSDSEWIGRIGFERPIEKQFPFRRTVFIFGLPMDCGEKYITEMLSPFGKLSKIKFDHGPDTLDRLVSENMFKEMKVYKYRELSNTNKILYNYKQEIMVGGSTQYNCNKCLKLKQCDEGFYETNSYQILICLQCAAACAELILEKCKSPNISINKRMIQLLCGKSPRNINKTKTALAVFTSQRQASKCVYVRSRIAYDGCFATHYHHYSKLKKEIALTLQPFHHSKLKQIPPLSHTNICNSNIIMTQLQKSQPSPPPPLPSSLSSSPSPSPSPQPQPQPNIKNIKNTPKIKKSSIGSVTAPVFGGHGEIYLMRPAYNKVNNNSSINASFIDDDAHK